MHAERCECACAVHASNPPIAYSTATATRGASCCTASALSFNRGPEGKQFAGDAFLIENNTPPWFPPTNNGMDC
jgi:hypothetical protein